MPINDKYVTINIQTNTPTFNAEREQVDSWATTSTVQGIIIPLQGNKIFINDKRTLLADSVLTCAITTILNTQRINYNSINYKILYVETDPRSPESFDRFMKVWLEYVS